MYKKYGRENRGHLNLIVWVFKGLLDYNDTKILFDEGAPCGSTHDYVQRRYACFVFRSTNSRISPVWSQSTCECGLG